MSKNSKEPYPHILKDISDRVKALETSDLDLVWSVPRIRSANSSGISLGTILGYKEEDFQAMLLATKLVTSVGSVQIGPTGTLWSERLGIQTEFRKAYNSNFVRFIFDHNEEAARSSPVDYCGSTGLLKYQEFFSKRTSNGVGRLRRLSPAAAEELDDWKLEQYYAGLSTKSAKLHKDVHDAGDAEDCEIPLNELYHQRRTDPLYARERRDLLEDVLNDVEDSIITFQQRVTNKPKHWFRWPYLTFHKDNPEKSRDRSKTMVSSAFLTSFFTIVFGSVAVGVFSMLHLLQRLDSEVFDKTIMKMGYPCKQQQLTPEETIAIQQAGNMTGQAMRRVNQVLKHILESPVHLFSSQVKVKLTQPSRSNEQIHAKIVHRVLQSRFN